MLSFDTLLDKAITGGDAFIDFKARESKAAIAELDAQTRNLKARGVEKVSDQDAEDARDSSGEGSFSTINFRDPLVIGGVLVGIAVLGFIVTKVIK